MAKQEWEITLWSEGELVDDTHTFTGDWRGALERAEDVVLEWRRGWTRPLEAEVRPAGVLFESLPNGWRIDEDLGWLVPLRDVVDPLPHAAVRVMKGGAVLAICEPGIPQVRHALDVVGQVVKAHLGSSCRTVTMEVVVACQKQLEDDLGRLAARGRIRARDGEKGRVWAAA
jgi:hypothetical protein